jgi:hypothetical protein
MSKKSMKHKHVLSSEDKAVGKTRIYIILGMIVVGLALALYRINQ